MTVAALICAITDPVLRCSRLAEMGSAVVVALCGLDLGAAIGVSREIAVENLRVSTGVGPSMELLPCTEAIMIQWACLHVLQSTGDTMHKLDKDSNCCASRRAKI